MSKLFAVTGYFRRDPESLFLFLDKHMKGEDSHVPVYIWVDNDDHKTSSEFYKLRKLMRLGLNINVFIRPPLNTEKEVYEFLEERARIK